MPDSTAVTLQALSLITTDGAGASVDVGAVRNMAKLVLDVRAVTGTGASLTVAVESSPDNASWETIRTLGPITEAARIEASIAGTGRYLRASRTITGTTPSVLYSLTGDALVVYALPANLSAAGMPAASLAGVSPDTIAAKLLAASTVAADYLRAAYDMPLVAWGDSLSLRVAQIAAYLIIAERGLDPSGPDKSFADGNKEAIAWLKEVKGGLPLEGVIDSTPDVLETAAYVFTRPSRGWDR